MSPPLLLVVILLGSYAAISIAAGLLVALVARSLTNRERRLSANAWFGLRVAPPFVATAFALACVWPAFVAFEPATANEQPGPWLVGFGTVSAAILAVSAFRLTRGLWACHRFGRRWLPGATIEMSPGLALPIHVVDAPTPLAALIGVLRPRLVMSARLVRTCTASELRMISAHESAHLRTGDNVKRLILHACPDPLRWTGMHRRLVDAWSSASEEEADDRAVSPADGPGRLALADLLLKVARFGPTCPAPQVSSPLIAPLGFARRIRRLLEPVSVPAHSARPWRIIAVAGTVAIAAAVLVQPSSLFRIHQTVELFVGFGR